MLIFQHKLSNKSNNADNSAYMLKIQQHQYHKLKNCRIWNLEKGESLGVVGWDQLKLRMDPPGIAWVGN